MSGNDAIGFAIPAAIAVIVLAVIAMRFLAWWWLGIGDRLNESKRTNELLMRNNELLEQLIAPPLPPVDAPTIEQPKTQPRRNPLTQR